MRRRAGVGQSEGPGQAGASESGVKRPQSKGLVGQFTSRVLADAQYKALFNLPLVHEYDLEDFAEAFFAHVAERSEETRRLLSKNIANLVDITFVPELYGEVQDASAMMLNLIRMAAEFAGTDAEDLPAELIEEYRAIEGEQNRSYKMEKRKIRELRAALSSYTTSRELRQSPEKYIDDCFERIFTAIMDFIPCRDGNIMLRKNTKHDMRKGYYSRNGRFLKTVDFRFVAPDGISEEDKKRFDEAREGHKESLENFYNDLNNTLHVLDLLYTINKATPVLKFANKRCIDNWHYDEEIVFSDDYLYRNQIFWDRVIKDHFWEIMYPNSELFCNRLQIPLREVYVDENGNKQKAVIGVMTFDAFFGSEELAKRRMPEELEQLLGKYREFHDKKSVLIEEKAVEYLTDKQKQQIIEDFKESIGKQVDGNKITEGSLIKEKSLEYLTRQQKRIILKDAQKELLCQHTGLTKQEKRELLVKERLINPLTKEEKEKLDSYFDVEPPLSRQKIILIQELADEVVPVIRNAQHLFELRDIGLRLAQWSKMSSLGGLVGGVTHKLDNPLTSLTIALRGHRREVGHVLETLEAYEALGDSILEMVEEDPELLQRAPGLKGVVEQLASIREKQRERASKGKPPLADSLEGYLAAAKRGLDRIGEVVSRLRVYSRTDQFAELEKIDLKDGFEAGVDINEVIRRTLEHLDIEGTQRRHRIEVETRFNHEAPRIRCNPRLLADVIANLVSNAVDAVVERLGHESFEPEVRVETNVIDDGIEIKVMDNGVGIRPEHLFTVFDPFFSTKPEGKGAGLGLSIAQANVRAHGGWIKAHSDGKGATFTILLPVKRRL